MLLPEFLWSDRHYGLPTTSNKRTFMNGTFISLPHLSSSLLWLPYQCYNCCGFFTCEFRTYDAELRNRLSKLKKFPLSFPKIYQEKKNDSWLCHLITRVWSLLIKQVNIFGIYVLCMRMSGFQITSFGYHNEKVHINIFILVVIDNVLARRRIRHIPKISI